MKDDKIISLYTQLIQEELAQTKDLQKVIRLTVLPTWLRRNAAWMLSKKGMTSKDAYYIYSYSLCDTDEFGLLKQEGLVAKFTETMSPNSLLKLLNSYGKLNQKSREVINYAILRHKDKTARHCAELVNGLSSKELVRNAFSTLKKMRADNATIGERFLGSNFDSIIPDDIKVAAGDYILGNKPKGKDFYPIISMFSRANQFRNKNLLVKAVDMLYKVRKTNEDRVQIITGEINALYYQKGTPRTKAITCTNEILAQRKVEVEILSRLVLNAPTVDLQELAAEKLLKDFKGRLDAEWVWTFQEENISQDVKKRTAEMILGIPEKNYNPKNERVSDLSRILTYVTDMPVKVKTATKLLEILKREIKNKKSDFNAKEKLVEILKVSSMQEKTITWFLSIKPNKEWCEYTYKNTKEFLPEKLLNKLGVKPLTREQILKELAKK